jgi:hypothetical protein
MSNDLFRAVLAVLVLAHGIGHVLFAPLAFSTLRLPSSGESWLLSGALGKGVTDVIATAIALALVAAFSIAAYGLFAQTAWWRGLLVGASLISIGLIVVFWAGLPDSSAIAALAFDGAVLVSVLVLHWPADAGAAA